MIRPFAFLRAAILATSLLAAGSAAAADVQLLTEGPTPRILTSALKDGTDVPCSLTVDNGASLTGVGARYKGNSSFVMGGAKKSLNVTVN